MSEIDLKASPVSRTNVLGVGISHLDLSLATSLCQEFVQKPANLGYVTVTGVHGVMESQRDPELLKIHNQSFLSTPDGMPMVWLARLDGYSSMDRVYGPDLMLKISKESPEREQTHYYFGGAEGVASKLKLALQDKFSALNVVGLYEPPFRPLNEKEEQHLVAELHRLQPHYFWVGLSTPKQERFMADFQLKYPDLTKDWPHGMLMFGVGAAFDFHAGLVSQAPRFIQRSGMEWFYRLCMEPKRLWKRYTSNNSRFLIAIAAQLTGLKKYQMMK